MADRTIFARALPESVRIAETYRYRQTVTHNAAQDVVGAPKGELTVRVAYDGQRSFSRQAWLDVQHQDALRAKDGQEQTALIGQLIFANTARTRLSNVLDLHSQSNSAPIRVPIAHPVLETLGDLINGEHAWEASVTYEPDEPATWPIRLTLDVRDEKSTGSVSEPMETRSSPPSMKDLAEAVTRHLAIPRALTLLARVRVDLPSPPPSENWLPVVTKVQVKWPRFTSLRGFWVANDDKPDEAIVFRFDPITRSLEWSGPLLTPGKRMASTGVRSYFSPTMALTIEQPSDLYVETNETQRNGAARWPLSETLSGEVEVEAPDWLLSGLQVRLFDATGRLVERPLVHLKTVLRVDFELNLDDVFARRTLSPRQHIVFEQVIPNALRVLDVKTALGDRGFSIEDRGHFEFPDKTTWHLLRAERPEGSDRLVLLVVIEGKIHKARRESEIPGGQRYASDFESGELVIHMAGELPGNSKPLIREMNILQQALRARFEPLRANR
jgi:hypothetical protein